MNLKLASKVLLTVVLLLSFVKSNAQHLGDTYLDIIIAEGSGCFEDATEIGQKFIVYRSTANNFTQSHIYFFRTVKSRITQEKTELCTQEIMADTLPRINTTITKLTARFVRTGNLVWRDYSTDVIYEIEIDRTEQVYMLMMYYGDTNTLNKD